MPKSRFDSIERTLAEEHSSMRKTHKILLLIATLAISTLLASCGFQLRGAAQSLPGWMSPVYVTGLAPYTPFRRELHRALSDAGLTPTRERAGAGSILHIHKHKQGERILSSDSRGKVVEVELEEILRFSLRDGSGTERVPEQQVRIERAYLDPEINTLGLRNERSTIREEMERDAIARMINRLAAQTQ